METALTLKSLINRDDVKNKLKEMLGEKAPAFITSVLQIASSNDLLAKADPMSIYMAACTAATLDLPLNNALGFAYLVPFNAKQKDGSYKTLAQFQIGAKGLVQLAKRTGQLIGINTSDVREGEIKERDRLTGGIVFSWNQTKEREGMPVIGYVAYMKESNGFEKTLFMTLEELKAHGLRFSQTYKKGFGLWKDDFDSMAKKTVLKLLLSKWGSLSITLQKAIISDQAVINEDGEPSYVDHEVLDIDKEAIRVLQFIESATVKEQLEQVKGELSTEELREAYAKKEKELK